jgi:hypothetical protein
MAVARLHHLVVMVHRPRLQTRAKVVVVVLALTSCIKALLEKALEKLPQIYDLEF